MDLRKASREELAKLEATLLQEYNACKEKGLKLDMSRGKPGADQLDLSEAMLRVLAHNEDLIADGLDTRNYGVLDGIPACRAMFAELLGVPAKNIIAGGNASLTMMYDNIMRLWVFGAPGCTPWSKQEKVKFLCPVPGYDRHFAICEQLGIEMINVPMLEDGPDMNMVKQYVEGDSAVKGIWCVPQYSNPEGKTYSDDVVRAFANLTPAAPDFRIMWDNAYCVHHLYEKQDHVLNLFTELEKTDKLDMLFMFASTSKISYPGAGVAVMACSDANIAWTKKIMGVQAIGPDKINQLRHVRFFGNAEGVSAHMQRHAEILAPKFDVVLETLERRIGGTGAGTWHKPAGGYFVSFDAMSGCATKIYELCKEAGLVITGAGATFPYGKDANDSNLRIAPSFPTTEELKVAMDLFCTCALLAACRKRMTEIA